VNEQPQPAFGPDGLVAAVAQDATSKAVLMLAWMNREAWEATLRTRRATFWSRSRNELWEKGATSGNTLHVREIRVDCDADAVLLLVDADGPACHTGNTSCFFREVPTE
jgi:phosphoribosyl-AMP cyclohydrolase